MKNAIVYARVSSAEQARPDASSIDQQIERGEAYAKAQGWEVVGVIKDEGITGASALAERPEGRRLLLTEADVIITWAIDRFTRRAATGLVDIEALEARGVALVFVKEAIDTSTPSGRLFRTMLTAFAEFEREQIRDRNMSGRYGAAEKGKWATGQLPFGYVLGEDGNIITNSEEAHAVICAFELRVFEGWGLSRIAEHLNARGLQPRARRDRVTGEVRTSKFSAGSIRAYLTNEVYKGGGIQRRMSATLGSEQRTFTWPAPAIVSREDWDAAQKVRL